MQWRDSRVNGRTNARNAEGPCCGNLREFTRIARALIRRGSTPPEEATREAASSPSRLRRNLGDESPMIRYDIRYVDRIDLSVWAKVRKAKILLLIRRSFFLFSFFIHPSPIETNSKDSSQGQWTDYQILIIGSRERERESCPRTFAHSSIARCFSRPRHCRLYDACVSARMELELRAAPTNTEARRRLRILIDG
jgi:hypothetical protein